MSCNWYIALLQSDLSTALAKGVYLDSEDQNKEYDVVTGFVDPDYKTGMLAWVISYEEAAHGLQRDYLLQSRQCPSIEDAYQSLIQALRVRITRAGQSETKSATKIRLANDIKGLARNLQRRTTCVSRRMCDD